MKKLFALMSALALVFTLGACDIEEAFSEEASSYLSVAVNPEIEFILDDEGVVESFVLVNEDAEIVAADLDFEGLEKDEALDKFIEAAIETGYIDVDEEDNAVFVRAADEDEGREENLREEARARIEEALRNRGVAGAVFDEELEEEIVEFTESHDIGYGRARLILRAAEVDEELTPEEALELEMREIMEILRGAHQERMESFREERREEARAIRDEMKEEVRERVEEHRQRAEDDFDLPDFEEKREEMRPDIEERREEFRNRMKERRNEVKDRMPFNDENDSDE